MPTAIAARGLAAHTQVDMLRSRFSPHTQHRPAAGGSRSRRALAEDGRAVVLHRLRIVRASAVGFRYERPITSRPNGALVGNSQDMESGAANGHP